MKKLFCLCAFVFSLSVFNANAQYKPTEKDLGKDCTTQEGKLGTWKKGVARDDSGSNYNSSSSTSGSAGFSVGNKEVGSVSASGAHSNTSSQGRSTGSSFEYEDIRCVEDKNATLPQQTPVRW